MTAVKDKVQFDLASLIQTHQADLWRYVRYLGASSAEADDLVQESFLTVARRPFQQRSEDASAAYLRTVIRRQLLMLRRKQRREVSTVALDSAEQVWREMNEGSSSRRLVALSECLKKLTLRANESLRLFYSEGLSREETAAEMGMKPDGVKSLLRRTRDQLRECIKRKAKSG